MVALAPAGWARQLGGQDHRYREATYLARIYDHLSGIDVDLIHDHNEATGILMAAAVGERHGFAHGHQNAARAARFLPHRTVAECEIAFLGKPVPADRQHLVAVG